MKRAGNLYWKIAEIENLELAFWKAQRGKSGNAAGIYHCRSTSVHERRLIGYHKQRAGKRRLFFVWKKENCTDIYNYEKIVKKIYLR